MKKIKGLELEEIAVKTQAGEYLVFPSYAQNPQGVDYVRFIDKQGNELAYWNSDEWAEDPELVMGAIMGALQNGAESIEDTNNEFGAMQRFIDRSATPDLY
jgi:hypothetical protein